MRKLSKFLVVFVMLISGFLFAACGQDTKPEIKFSQSNVVIYLNENNSSQTINASLIGANVDMLSFAYDNTYFTITPSGKLSDGSFDLTISAKGDVGCEDVEVMVRAGAHLQNSFFVTIVVELEDIIPSENAYVAFNTESGAKLNLFNEVTFAPSTTKQKSVEFYLFDESKSEYVKEVTGYGKIEGYNLIVDPTFDSFETPIKVVVQSLESGKEEIRKEFEVSVVPNVALFGSQVIMMADYGAGKVSFNKEEGVNLSINQVAGTNLYELGTFNVYVQIPKAIGIDVDVDSMFNAQNNVMQYLNVQKRSYELDEYTTEVQFVFTSLNLKSTSNSLLYFKFFYVEAQFKQDENLMARFVNFDSEIGDCVNVSIEIPLERIACLESGVISNNTHFKIYSSYSSSMYGTQIVLTTVPSNATNQEISIKNMENIEAYVWNEKEYRYIQLVAIGEDGINSFNSRTPIYVKGLSGALTGKLIVESSGKELQLTFDIQKGTTAFGFVSNYNEKPVVEKNIAVECANEDGTIVLLYAPNTDIGNLIYDATVIQNLINCSDIGQPNYFRFKVVSSQVGERKISISTLNGYLAILSVQTIQPLTYVNLKLQNLQENIVGIGGTPIYKGNDLYKISIKNGYSVPLIYETNENTEIAEIKYQFANVVLGSAGYENVYTTEYVNFSETDKTYTDYSTIINSQNIKNVNVLTAMNQGKVAIKVVIAGYIVVDGKIVVVGEADAIVKYMVVEVYNPIKDISSTAKTIEIRSENQLDADNISIATKTIDLTAVDGNGKLASYNKIYIDGGELVNIDDKNYITYSYKNSYDGGDLSYSAKLDIDTNQLSITLHEIPKDYNTDLTQSITLFVADFYMGTDSTYYLSNLKYSFEIISYVVNLKILETLGVEDISVDSLKLEEEQIVDGVKVKTYERIYLSTAKLETGVTAVYKIVTSIMPANAFNRSLKYTFIPDYNVSSGLVNVSSNDGCIYYSDVVGGTGTIQIEPADEKLKTVKILIPIVLADGNSKQTAFEITDLSEIINPTKHYKIVTSNTLILEKTLFKGQEFLGGLYGKDNENGTTIRVDGCSLFDVIGSNAVVSSIVLYGDATANGFIANKNNGTIENVKVTTFIKDSIYMPSLLTEPHENKDAVGGLVGQNNGTILASIFAGSIKLTTENSRNVDGIAGANTGKIGIDVGTEEEKERSKCFIIVAKFDYILGRTIAGGVGTIFEGAYVNGIISVVASSVGAHFENNLMTATFLSGNEYVKTNNDHSIGEVGAKYGIVFYYEAEEDSAEVKEKLSPYNSILISDLIYSDCTNIKAIAINTDGTPCNFVSVSGNVVHINGIGEFVLKIYSEFDYKTAVEINMLSIYYMSNFGIYLDGNLIQKDSTIKIIKDRREIVNSVTQNLVDNIVIKQNNFTINFNFENISFTAIDYITGNKLGSHAINASWGVETQRLGVLLSTGKGEQFDALLNGRFCSEYVFDLQVVLGTTKVETSSSERSIEPNDSVTFDVIITTDNIDDEGNSKDFIKDNSNNSTTITVTNQNGYQFTGQEISNIFDIYIGGQRKVANKHNSFAFEVTIALKESVKHLQQYVDQTYTLKIQATNGSTTYEVYAIYNLTILPQTLSNINVTVYNITSQTAETEDDKEKNEDKLYVLQEAPTSVIKPTDSALMVVDLFPNFATFDYVEIVATSTTLTKLAYRVQKRSGNSFTYDSEAKVEALTNANGVKIYNSFKNTSQRQNIGTYYLKIFAINTLNEDVIFNITTTAYYKGEKLSNSSVFSLYLKMPAKPEVTVNGKTLIYAYPGETLSATIQMASDQTLSSIELRDMNDKVQKTYPLPTPLAEQENAEVLSYIFNFEIPYSDVSSSNYKKTLVVTSIKTDRGEQVKAQSEVFIYLVDFKAPENSITIADANDGIFNVSSIKYKTLKLNTNLLGYYDATNVNTAIESFNENYYFENLFADATRGFVFGNNKGNSAYNLASYLYFLNGNEQTPIAKFENNNIIFADSNYSSNIKFKILQVESEDGEIGYELQVKGGEQTGEVPILMEIRYVTPDGNEHVYQYNFKIVNSVYTSEDMPIEIAGANSFKAIETVEKAENYILSSDIYLYNYNPFNDTSKILSLDGNNYTIHIMSFEQTDQTTLNYALFQNVSAITTLKNITVNYHYLSEIEVSNTVNSVNFAGFAITNSGIIYNCEVMSYYDSEEKRPTHSTYGIKIVSEQNTTTKINVAGFVLTNGGSITHSRVGSNSKLISKFDYTDPKNPQLRTQIINGNGFTLRASGTISGFCYTNNGIIASSYVKNISLVNTYNHGETMVTSGFVNYNEGKISMCYVEGIRQKDEIQIVNGGIESAGIMAGFVYTNTSEILDCYSNLMIQSQNNQIGRLGAGFVYYNSPTAFIKTSYSFSRVIGNNTTQLNFVGITDLMQYNNLGSIKNCYYYVTDESELESVEKLFNTDIQMVKAVNNQLNFYGFSFGSQYNKELSATWVASEYGPQLVSANDIAHSIRYKLEDEQAIGNSTLGYMFIYNEDYDYGTINNPIIIRSATEFNGVMGGYVNSNTEIEENFNLTNKKVFGTYRLVNNIDLQDLIIEDKQDSDYKYNLATTGLVLTGEFKDTSKRAGSFNGNGLTINNLAISNEQTVGSTNYGMFSSLENGANFSNVNIILAKGGVKADNTKYVGTIAGTLSNSALTNVNISTNSEESHTDVIGSNIVGGAVGRVIKNSYVFGISAQDVSVIATYYRNINTNTSTGNIRDNKYDKNESTTSENSIAGGVFGVIDTYTDSQEKENENKAEDDVRFANVQGIATSGSMKISAMTVGGVIGFVGKNVIAKDLSLTIEDNNAKIISYNYIAGGVVGYNMGYLYQVKAEHEATLQANIESSMEEYYNATTQEEKAKTNRGNTNLFIASGSETAYSPFVIGGLIGVMDNGIINVGYSKIHVINNKAMYAGGIVGYINSELPKEGATETELTFSVQLVQVYATGDVYAGAENSKAKAYTGGIFAYNKNNSLELDRISAFNYWGDTIENINDNHIFNQVGYTETTGIGIIVTKVAVLQKVEINGKTFNSDSKEFIIGNLRAGASLTEKDKVIYKTIPAYNGYGGVDEDGGARIDYAFVENEWYSTGNWEKDNLELYPHIKYTSPVSIYEINTTDDFWKFGAYGNNADARFVVTNEGLIDCSSVNTTYPMLKGALTGMYENSGFAGLQVPLFKTIYGTVSNLTFGGCSAPIAYKATGQARFTYLIYEGCEFAKTQNDTTKNCKNLAGVVYTVSAYNGSVVFNNIKFTGCSLSPVDNAKVINAGYLYAYATATEGNIDISQIQIENATMNGAELVGGSNVGFLFGESSSKTGVESVSISIQNQSIITANNAQEKNTTFGYIGGLAGVVEISNVSVSHAYSGGEPSDAKESDYARISITDQEGSLESKTSIYVGGLIGRATEFTIANSNTSDSADLNYEYFNASINVGGKFKNIYVGGLVGYCSDVVTISLSKDVTVGSQESCLQVKTNAETTSIGGIAGFTSKIDSSLSSCYMVYDGDIVITHEETDSASTASTTSQNVYVGGAFGSIGADGKTESHNLNNIVVNGSISFEKSVVGNSQTHYIGGIAGHVQNGNKIVLTNVYALGDIILSGDNDCGLITTKPSYVGGVFGQTNINVEFTGKNFSLSTIFYKHNLMVENATTKKMEQIIHIDAVLNKTGSVIISGEKNAIYASNLTLCTSSVGATNTTYNDSTIAENNSGVIKEKSQDGVLTQMEEKIKGLLASKKGSKLNPIVYSELTLSTSALESNTISGVFETKVETGTSGNSAFELIGGDETTTTRRKVFIKYESNLDDVLAVPISLKNTILFSDGGVIYSYFTPFNNIDANSAVSGIVAKVIIGNSQRELAISDEVKFNVVNYGAFANVNNGIIFTCAVQEPLQMPNHTNTYGTYFYSEMVADVKSSTSAGFVSTNSGYIFGSNSNVHIAVSAESVNIAGFVGANTGVIDHSYANGYVSLTSNSASVINLDLFAKPNNKETCHNDDVTNCYTLFANKVGAIENITVMKNVKYEQDATETKTNIVLSALDVLQGKGSASEKVSTTALFNENTTNTMYVVTSGINYFYPYLGGGAFENIPYTQKLTVLQRVKHAGIKQSGVTTDIYQYTTKATDTSVLAELIPNITVLKHITNSKNYVITRDLGFAHKGDMSKTFVSNSEIVNTYIDGFGKKISNINLKDNAMLINTLDAGSTIYNLGFENIKLTNTSGLIAENNGTIEKCKLSGDENTITLNKKDTSLTIGMIVASNAGMVKKFNMNATIKVESSVTNVNIITVGGIIGNNKWNGTLTNSTSNNSTIHCLSENLCMAQVGGLVGVMQNGSIVTLNSIESTLISVATGYNNSTSYAGGIVGFMNGGEVYQCFVDEDSQIISGSESVNDPIDIVNNTGSVGFITEQSYAGGLIATANAGQIYDCENRASVSARANWVLDAEAFGEYIDPLSRKFKYFYDPETGLNHVIVYAVMESKAYAGGVVSNYLTAGNVATTGQEIGGDKVATRLTNHGLISGGFKAWKPIMVLSGSEQAQLALGNLALSGAQHVANGAFGATFKTAGSMLVKKYTTDALGLVVKETVKLAGKEAAKAAVKGFAGTITKFVPFLGWAYAAYEVYQLGKEINNMINEAQTVDLFADVVGGNGDYFSNLNDYNNGDSDSGKLNNESGKLGIEFFASLFGGKLLSGDDAPAFNPRSDGNKVSNKQNQKNFFDGKSMGIETIKSIKITRDGENITYLNYGAVGKDQNYFLNYEDAVGGSVLQEIYYDTICPNINSSSETLNVYSSTKNYQDATDGRVTLNISNEFNSVLEFKKSEVSENNYGNYDNFKNWESEENSAWKDDSLTTSSKETLEFEKKEIDGIEYNYIELTDETLWSSLVYTVNNNVEYQGENTIIEINIDSSSRQFITIGTDVFDKFDGKFIVKSKNTVFTGMKFNLNDKTNLGFIRESTLATIENFEYYGDVQLINNKTENTNKYTLGVVVGCANGDGGVVIKNASVSVGQIRSNKAVNLATIGGLVGVVINNNLSVNDTKAYVNNVDVEFGVPEGFNSDTTCAFGTVVGSAQSGSVQLKAIEVEVADVNLVGAISYVGGVIGYTNATTVLESCYVKVGKLCASSNNNTYVSGIVGYSNKSLTLSAEIVISEVSAISYNATIASDVLEINKVPYASGVIAYANGTINSEHAKITVGSTGSGYKSVMNVLAGYCVIENVSVLPKVAYANKYINGNIELGGLLTHINVIARALACGYGGSYTDITQATSSTDITSAGFTVVNNKISFSNTATSSNKNDVEYGYINNSMDYSVEKATYIDNSSTGGVVNEFRVEFTSENYSRYITDFDTDESGNATNLTWDTANVDNSITYLIRIVKSNKNVNSSNTCLIQVILEESDLSGEINTIGTNVVIFEQLINYTEEIKDSKGLYVPSLESLNPAISLTSIDNNGLTHYLQSTRTSFMQKYDDVENKYVLSFVETLTLIDVGEDNKMTTRSISRTLFSVDLSSDETAYTKETATISGVTAYSTAIITKEDGSEITHNLNQGDMIYNGYLIDNKNHVSLNGKAVNNLNVYNTTINGTKVQIVSAEIVEGSNRNFTEFIYEKENVTGASYKYRGTIAYTLPNNLFESTEAGFEALELKERYESYFPVLDGDNADAIFNIKSDILSNGNLSSSNGNILDKLNFVQYAYSVNLKTNQFTTIETKFEIKYDQNSGKFMRGSQISRQEGKILTTETFNISAKAGDYEGKGYLEHYLFNDKLVGYKQGENYYYYNQKDGTTLDNGTNKLTFTKFVVAE